MLADDLAESIETKPAAMRFLVTAREAFPALEQLFLTAESEVWASFRIFDLRTKLRSQAGREIGATWFDLMRDTLSRGVEINFILTDFDPIGATPLHRTSWQSMQQFAAVGECATGGTLNISVDMHPARTGWVPRILFWPLVLHRIKGKVRELNDADPELREALLRQLPGLRERLVIEGDDKTISLKAWPPPTLVPATHHQKLAVFDRRRLFIGGLDVNERRYDDPDHRRPGQSTWHDVSLISEGALVAEAQAHLETFRDHRKVAPPKPVAREYPAFLRTLSRHAGSALSIGARSYVTEIEDAHLDLIAKARHLLYFESQFFRHMTLARALGRAAQRNPDLTMIMMLPAAPEEVAFEGATGLDSRYGEYLQTRCVWHVRRAFGARCFIGMPLRPVPRQSDGRDSAEGADIIYIHSKIAIADDALGIVSSANMNGRSMRWDTEAGLIFGSAETTRLRERLFRHWLPPEPDNDALRIETAARAWSEIAERNAERAPEDRQGFLARYHIDPAARFGVPAPLFPPEMV